MSRADEYRNRDTGEIVGEQKELERLRRQSIFYRHPYWEWSKENGEYLSAQRWIDLLGQLKDPVFPEWEAGQEIEHEDLVDFIDRWVDNVAEQDKVEAGDRAREFLLGKPVNKTFDHSYCFVHENGSLVPVQTKAQSMWKDKKLVALFSETRSLGQIRGREAEAISNNKDAIKAQSAVLEKLSSALSAAKTWWPLLLAGTVLFNDGLALLIEQAQRTYRLVVQPIQTARLQVRNNLLPEWVTQEDISKAQQTVRPFGQWGEVTLWIYDPGEYPTRYAPLVKASPEEIIRFGEGTSAYDTGADKQVQEMTRNHISGQAFELPSVYLYSLPFTVEREDGRPQTFFVEIVASPNSDRARVQTEMNKLKQKLAELFEP